METSLPITNYDYLLAKLPYPILCLANFITFNKGQDFGACSSNSKGAESAAFVLENKWAVTAQY